MTNPFASTKAPSDSFFEFDLPAEDDNPFYVPPGDHPVRAVNLTSETSKSGNPMFVLELEIVAGPAEGKKLKTWITRSPAAAWKFREVLVAFGLVTGSGPAKGKFDPRQIIGKAAIAQVEDSEYNGKTTSSVAKVLPPTAEAEAAVIRSTPF